MPLSHYSINCQCCPHRETSQAACCANYLTGFHMRATLLTFNGVKASVKQNETKKLVVRSTYFQNLKCNVKNMYFSFNFGWHSIWPNIISYEQGVGVLTQRTKSTKNEKSYLCQWSLTHNISTQVNLDSIHCIQQNIWAKLSMTSQSNILHMIYKLIPLGI